jgi:tetratricopeptide (TPR) repeat protein
MCRRYGFLFAFAAAALGTIALADDEIYLKSKGGKAAKGVIIAESVKDDILYEWPTGSDVIAGLALTSAFKSERDWMAASDAKKRAVAFKSALDSYESASTKAADKRIKAHIDFKIGYLRGQKALEDNADTKVAAARLRDFVTKNPNGWQVARALLLLAKLQSDGKDYAGAEQSYAELAKLDVAEDVKNDAKLQGALLNLRLNKVSVAEAKLADLLKTLQPGSKSYARALVAQAECMLAAKKPAEAVEILKKAIKESDDKALRATAYNALGTHFYESDQFKEARWEFLWVDVVYNQDKHEHARALYYLSHIFDKLADPNNATKCRDTLLSPAFGGTEHQRKLQKEQK